MPAIMILWGFIIGTSAGFTAQILADKVHDAKDGNRDLRVIIAPAPEKKEVK